MSIQNKVLAHLTDAVMACQEWLSFFERSDAEAFVIAMAGAAIKYGITREMLIEMVDGR